MIHVVVYDRNKVYFRGFSMHKSATDAEVKAAVDVVAYDNEMFAGYFFEIEGRI